MATNFTQRDAALDEIATRITGEINRMNQAVAAFTTAKGNLAALASQYGAIITEINESATASPNDAAVQAQKARKDKYVADFQAAQTRATSLETAVDGI
jgi:hypothetical protein